MREFLRTECGAAVRKESVAVWSASGEGETGAKSPATEVAGASGEGEGETAQKSPEVLLSKKARKLASTVASASGDGVTGEKSPAAKSRKLSRKSVVAAGGNAALGTGATGATGSDDAGKTDDCGADGKVEAASTQPEAEAASAKAETSKKGTQRKADKDAAADTTADAAAAKSEAASSGSQRKRKVAEVAQNGNAKLAKAAMQLNMVSEAALPDAGDATAESITEEMRRFTPEIVPERCMARVWNGGKGGQCEKKFSPESGLDLCGMHLRSCSHGRLDGPIPPGKLQVFLKASGGTTRKAAAPEAVEAVQAPASPQDAD